MRRGFSLVELLVVLAIVGILISFMVPAIGGAQRLNQTTVCKNNQRQLVLAAVQYTNDFETFPVFFKNRDQKSAIDVALENNQIRSVNAMVHYMTKY